MQAPADLGTRTFDLLVVGGGINGAAIARDAALRGLSVCLVEKEDWGWGTSAKSSKLAHGGLRYLEMLEFGLVHEALHDRELFFRHAPHLVRPLRFLYPIYPHVAARRAVRAGLLLYDLLSRGKSVPNRKYHGRTATLQLAPGLSPEGLTGGATYYDGQIQHVERLIAEMVWDAKRHGALCLNHTRVICLDLADGPRRVTGATLEVAGKPVQVRAQATVNAAGCWVDDVLGSLSSGKPPKVRKTKGAHVVVPKFTEVALIVKAARDGRTFFILPWQDACVIGTTDTDYEGDPADAAASDEDVAYLLDEAARYFPEAPLDRIRYTYAGVRALVNEQGVTESNVTRRHILYDHAHRDGVHCLWSLQGGKITTARTLAEETVDRVCAASGREELAALHPTRTTPYPGGPVLAWARYRDGAVAAAQAEAGLPAESAAHLVDTYGARWRLVLAADERPEARRPVFAGLPHLGCEVTFAIDDEDATMLADVALRRTTIGLAADGNEHAARAVLEWMAERIGWDPAEQGRQWTHYQHQARTLAVPQVTVTTMRNVSTSPARPPPRSTLRKTP